MWVVVLAGFCMGLAAGVWIGTRPDPSELDVDDFARKVTHLAAHRERIERDLTG